MIPRCLKCGEAHQTKDCPIQRVETAYCINCQAYGHMANYSKCPLFPKPRKVISVYVPPSSDERLFTLDLENLLQTNSNCVIFGDFNATHNMWNCPNNSIRGCQLKTFVDTLDLSIAFPDTPTSYSGVANSDEQKANILAITLKNNISENKRPGDSNHPIDKEITNTLEKFFDNHPSIPISPTDPDEILNYIKTLKNNKAPGSDLITNK
ncbi:hypothetical protein TNCV_1579811 [Trichonephila clavipes]|nr:hypothetical protein TNCV_1579811 [Trichonephila clavipes]